MCDAHRRLDRSGIVAEHRDRDVRGSTLDKPEIVITAIVARPATILAAIAADPERAAALALARGYTDRMNDIRRIAAWHSDAVLFSNQRARHYYRVALGLETMDVTTGEA